MFAFLVILIHFTLDFWLQTTWMAMNKHRAWMPAIVHGAVYGLGFIVVSQDAIVLLVLAVSHTLIDHHRLATVIPRVVNWDWHGWQWHGWSNLKSFDPNDQPSYFPEGLNWLNIVADQILHLWILYFLFC